jgi:XTP/dITP diphosphohydrolase
MELSMKKVLLATNNNGKRIELEALLKNLEADFVTPGQLGIDIDVIEDGNTYAENALIKARAYCLASGLQALADDSGLEVAALDGLPGIHSARFSPKPGATDADRRKLLLEQLTGKPRPWSAQFRCVVALVLPEGDYTLAEGICPGEIITEERGANGFGYDPVFFLPELGRTMAELTLTEKNTLSHRALAIQAAIPKLTQWLQSAST